MPFHTHTLKNGLQIIGETNPAALCTAVAFWVRAGSRDETPEVGGVSHFLEHMVFKGTPRRNSFAVNRDFSRIGADNNAFTSEENTVFHAAFLPEFLPEAIDVLADVMRPSLRPEDFDTEKSVILDEIVRYEVQPGWATYDIEFPRLVELVEKACADWPTGTVERTNRRETKGAGGLHILNRPKDKVSQEYVLMMSSAPPADSPLRYAASLLATAIGDASGSRLFWALVDPGLAEEAGMGADECDSAGAFYTSFNCDPDEAGECYTIVRGILEDVQKNGIKADELELARTKIVSREVRSVERTHRRMLSLAKDWSYLKQYRTLDDELAAWDAVNLKTIREVLDRYPLTQFTTTALGPLVTL
ncbi:MAG: insulinase family protein [Planctomycetes bacterium]|nr:insulinase family protein [Planctomycetota bacterium]